MSSNKIQNIRFKDENVIHRQYLVMRLGKQLFGMLVDSVQDVLSPMKITPIPLAPPDVKGAMNLRGRIVTVINLRAVLGIEEEKEERSEYRSVVLEIEGNLYSIIIDSVSEVLDVGDDEIENLPDNISQKWRDVSSGVYPLENEIMIFLDPWKLFSCAEDKVEEIGEI